MSNDIKSKVKSLYEIMKEEKVQELEVNSDDYNICIKRKDTAENKQHAVLEKQDFDKNIAASSDKLKESSVPKETIKSPITGVFYKSSSPSAAAYVAEGSVVEPGKTVCIIEAMKVMNEIKAHFKAKILKILVENGKPVNSGQDLFEIEKVV
ncbi:MAG: hypothetical protein LBL71_03350 [Endomicrobium sp.]|jgi:acetyl-CoA carboxylase biotin carboxyl carrier protein|nr:hypothetical protein [Endomicrobium sp.]